MRREQIVQLAAELGHTGTQHRRVERHVDAGNQDERPLAAEFRTAPVDLGFEALQAAHGASDRVLRAQQVEVDHFEELAGLGRHVVDEAGHVGVGEPELAGTDGRHPVVAAALLISRNQMMHGLAALEDHLQDRFERQHTGAGGERVVLTHRMAAGDGPFDESARFLEFGDLCDSECGHRDLGELRQVQHAVGMVVGGASGHERGRIVTHHRQDREAQCGTGVLVGAVPHLACGLGPGSGVQTHPLGLDALAGEGVHGARCGEQTGRTHHQVVAHLGADLDHLAAGVEPDPVDAHGDGVAGAHHAQVAGCPAEQPPR